MRKNLAILVLAITVISCKMAKEEYSIKGSIAGVETGKVYLQKMVAGGQAETIDSTDVVAGKFTFAGKMPVPDFRFLRLNGQDYFAQFFLENANITVSANKDSLRSTKIAGSQSQDDFQIYLNEMERLQKEVKALHDKYQAAMKVNNTGEADKAKIDYQALLDNSLVFIKNFVKERPKSVVSAYITVQQLAPQIDEFELEEIVSKFPAEISTSEYVIQLKEQVQEKKKTSVGVLAPDFTMNDQDGKPFQFASLRGKIVLLDFWASWCLPCRQENPNVVKLYQKYHSKGLEIVGVSLDRTKENWLKGIKEDNLSWIHVSDLLFWKNAAARLYAVTNIPQSFLIDKDGKIIAKGLRGEQLEKKLAELFPNQ
jgi:peroxiredoxin